MSSVGTRIRIELSWESKGVLPEDSRDVLRDAPSRWAPTPFRLAERRSNARQARHIPRSAVPRAHAPRGRLLAPVRRKARIPESHERFTIRKAARRLGSSRRVCPRRPRRDHQPWSCRFRLWTDLDHSHGYVAPDMPELTVAVVPRSRSKGVGRALLQGLIQEAMSQGIRGLSLSVDPSNLARAPYESEGFDRVGESGTSRTYLLRLVPASRSNATDRLDGANQPAPS